MLRASLRSLLSRKLRLFLSVLAVVLGVAFVSGTFVLTDTLKSTFTSLFSNAYSHVDAAVQSKAAFSQNGTADREPLPESVLGTVRSVPGVAEATGTASGYAQLIGKDGKPIHNGGSPAIGISWTNSSLQPVTLLSGKPPVGGSQIAIDDKVAKQHHLAVGDNVKVLLAGPSRNVTITGIFRFATGGSLGGATLTAFDLPTAQQVYDLSGRLDTVLAKAAPGVSQADLLQRIGTALPKSAEVLSGQAYADQQSTQITDNLSFFNTFLLAIGFIALFVAAFIIANTFQMLVAQRVRELALMRAIGASRGQVNRSVQFEAFVVGLFGSTVGLILGVLLAIGLKAVLGLFGADLPSNGLVFKPRTAIVAYAIGIIVTMAAAFLPARKASRVPPVAAMRESWVEPQKALRSRTLIGLGALVVGIAALITGVDGGGFLLVILGALLVFGGVVSLSPMLSSPVVRLLGGPLSRLFGVTGKLAEENALRNPRRTAATASALMVGVALVAAFAVMGDSLKTSFHAIFRSGLTADYVLQPDQSSAPGFSTSVASTLKTTPGVTAVAGITGGPAEVNGSVKSLEAIDPVALPQVLNVKTLSGNLAAIGQDQIAISKTVADDKNYKVGQVLDVRFAKTGVQHIAVAAIYKKNQLAGDYLISRDYAHRNFTQSLDFVVLVNTEGGVSPAAQANIKHAVSAFPNVKVQTQAEYLHDADKQIDQLLSLIIVLLLLAIIIALLGIVNTLALSIVERTREIGLLRAVGMSRKQLRRSIRLEAGIIATYGAILGLVVGIGFGWALFRALRSQGIENFSVPIGMLVIALILAAVAGTLAAVWPARRAAKLDVLEAIATT
jgi:putative ABC transport system permease protein